MELQETLIKHMQEEDHDDEDGGNMMEYIQDLVEREMVQEVITALHDVRREIQMKKTREADRAELRADRLMRRQAAQEQRQAAQAAAKQSQAEQKTAPAKQDQVVPKKSVHKKAMKTMKTMKTRKARKAMKAMKAMKADGTS